MSVCVFTWEPLPYIYWQVGSWPLTERLSYSKMLSKCNQKGVNVLATPVT